MSAHPRDYPSQEELAQLPPIEENDVPLTLTVGDIKARLANMPNEMPVIGYARFDNSYTDEAAPGDVVFDGWVNLTDLHWDPTNPDLAVTIEVRDNYDSRQW